MGVGDRQTFHACAAGAFDAFFGVFDDDAFAGLDGVAVLLIQRCQRFEKNIRFRLAPFDIFGADDRFEVMD